VLQSSPRTRPRSEHRARSGFVFGCVSVVGLLVGLILGLVAGSAGVGLSPLVLLVGLLPGLALRLLGTPAEGRTCILAVLGVLPGLVLYAWLSSTKPAPTWRAEERLADEAKLDELIWSVKLVELVNQRGIEVWDYEAAPADIQKEARRIVAGMSRREKLALCERKYGKVLSRASTVPRPTEKRASPALWIVLTLLCTVGLLMVARQDSEGGPRKKGSAGRAQRRRTKFA
jgi:hypothetical protein